MPIHIDFTVYRRNDVTLAVTMTPATNISGWGISWTFQKYPESASGYTTKYCASGYNNVSGINVTDGENGRFNITLPSVNTSGLDPRLYYQVSERFDSGYITTLMDGQMFLK